MKGEEIWNHSIVKSELMVCLIAYCNTSIDDEKSGIKKGSKDVWDIFGKHCGKGCDDMRK